jgi:hypothetical protein
MQHVLHLSVIMTCGRQFFQIYRSYLKILGARRVTLSKSHNEDPQYKIQTGDLVPWACATDNDH